MGLLVEGRWQDQWYESSKDGAFQREQAKRRNWVTRDGRPGPSGEGGFKAEAGRYHLYVSLACRDNAARRNRLFCWTLTSSFARRQGRASVAHIHACVLQQHPRRGLGGARHRGVVAHQILGD